MAAANQQQVAALLKAIMAKGIESKDAIPTIKLLVEAKIFSLDALTESNVPTGIDPGVKKKLLPKKRKGTTKVAGSSNKKIKPSKAVAPIVKPAVTSRPSSILINRSPVLTLWATVVALRLYPKVTLAEAVSLGGSVAAQLSQAKGTSLGIFQAREAEDNVDKVQADDDGGDNNHDERIFEFDLLGFAVLGSQTADGLRVRAEHGAEFQDPNKTWNLLQRRFGDALGHAMELMEQAGDIAMQQGQLEGTAYQYYVHIRPDVPQGTKGWGSHGKLHFDKLSSFYLKEG